MSSEIEQSKGGAPIGNTNAEKWTIAATTDKLMQLLEEAKKPNVLYIGQGLANLGLYHEWFSYVLNKYENEPVIFNTIKNIDQVFESKLVSSALLNEVNPTMAIFTLKNKHDWKDKTETENRNLNLNADVPLTAEKIKALKDKLKEDY